MAVGKKVGNSTELDSSPLLIFFFNLFLFTPSIWLNRNLKVDLRVEGVVFVGRDEQREIEKGSSCSFLVTGRHLCRPKGMW